MPDGTLSVTRRTAYSMVHVSYPGLSSEFMNRCINTGFWFVCQCKALVAQHYAGYCVGEESDMEGWK